MKLYYSRMLFRCRLLWDQKKYPVYIAVYIYICICICICICTFVCIYFCFCSKSYFNEHALQLTTFCLFIGWMRFNWCIKCSWEFSIVYFLFNLQLIIDHSTFVSVAELQFVLSVVLYTFNRPREERDKYNNGSALYIHCRLCRQGQWTHNTREYFI